MAYMTTEQLLAEISDYWAKQPDSNMYKLIDSFNKPFQEVDTDARKIKRWHALKNAKGTTLDLFGQDIETYRPSQNDDNYRFMIHVMQLLSRAQGTIPSIYKITSSALQYDKGYKVWQTGIRHIAIQIPFDAVDSVQMQKFILTNLQKMLALGYWIDFILMQTSTHNQQYIGAGNTDRTSYHDHLSSKWWTGWSARSFNHWYFGTQIHESKTYTERTKAKWWSGWGEQKDIGFTAGDKLVTTDFQDLDSK